MSKISTEMTKSCDGGRITEYHSRSLAKVKQQAQAPPDAPHHLRLKIKREDPNDSI